MKEFDELIDKLMAALKPENREGNLSVLLDEYFDSTIKDELQKEIDELYNQETLYGNSDLFKDYIKKKLEKYKSSLK